MRIFVAQINTTIGDLEGNTSKILASIASARMQGAELVLFPELAICGYPAEDFLLMPHFMRAIEEKLEQIIEASNDIAVVVGLPRLNLSQGEKKLFNSAAVIRNGKLLGYQDKFLLPTYDVFDERRYFEPGQQTHVWEINGIKVGITICEDIWQHADVLTYADYPVDPVQNLKNYEPDIVMNLSASPFSSVHRRDRVLVCSRAASTLRCPLIYCNQVGANDSLIFDGYSFYFDKNGLIIDYAKGFEEDHLLIDTNLHRPPRDFTNHPIEDLYKALVLGVKDYFHKSGFTRACLGLSGGIDSALVACLAVEALGKENVLCVGMPSRYTSQGSIDDARALTEHLGVDYKEISIESPFESYLTLMGPHFVNYKSDVTEENLQARIRGMILMALSNKMGYIVLSTGNKSELAMGYSTLYGDLCGGLAVISDVTKMQVYALAKWINRFKEVIPWNTINKPPSAELRPNQKDSDSLPPYEIVDNVLQNYVEEHLSPEEIAVKFGYPLSTVMDLVRKIHRNEYKRRQSAPGLRVSEKSFSVGRKFPIVQKWV